MKAIQQEHRGRYIYEGLSHLAEQISKIFPRAKIVIIKTNVLDLETVERPPALATGFFGVEPGFRLVTSLVMVVTSVRTVGVVGVGPLQ